MIYLQSSQPSWLYCLKKVLVCSFIVLVHLCTDIIPLLFFCLFVCFSFFASFSVHNIKYICKPMCMHLVLTLAFSVPSTASYHHVP